VIHRTGRSHRSNDVGSAAVAAPNGQTTAITLPGGEVGGDTELGLGAA